MENNFRKILESGLKELSVADSFFSAVENLDEKIDCLLAYHQLLIKWNKAYNLTAIRNPSEMLSRHLLDSLTIAPYIEGRRFIDVGTGAGLPGLVLAIFLPQLDFDLLDSNGKKTRFLFQVKTELKLSNVTIHHCRVENYHPELLYDGILSRAFATLEDMIMGSRQLLSEQGVFYAMKGNYPEAEIEAIKELSVSGKNYKVRACQQLQVPGQERQWHLVVINNATHQGSNSA